eukprot:164115-Alexandrium_andersonii.AAC.1
MTTSRRPGSRGGAHRATSSTSTRPCARRRRSRSAWRRCARRPRRPTPPATPGHEAMATA